MVFGGGVANDSYTACLRLVLSPMRFDLLRVFLSLVIKSKHLPKSAIWVVLNGFEAGTGCLLTSNPLMKGFVLLHFLA